MAIKALPPARQRVFRAVAAARRLPILSIAILLLVLVIPGIFANQVAPHDPLEGSVQNRLTPPAWVEGKVVVKEVVEKLDKDDRQILLRNAQRTIRIGQATIVGGTEGQQVAVGDRVEVVTKPGGSTKYLLGTDKVGRDMLSRIIHGARLSLSVALASIAMGAFVGVSLGLLAGYFGGNIDHLIMRMVDIKLAIPTLLLALVLATVMPSGIISVVIIIAIVLWGRYARIARGETLRVREMDYIARAKVAGCSDLRIIVRHVFPNITNSLIVLATLEVGQVIIFEASLSFLGVGIPPPHPAWGLMVADGRELIMTAWWVAFFPGFAMLLTVLSMNLFGDWLRDKLDPRMRNI